MRYLILLSTLVSSVTLYSLPIGFGRTEAGLEYNEIISPNFNIYHDKRAPSEARLILKSLEAAKPHLERWLEKERITTLPVIVSATTSNPSFANFITDAIELQTYGLGGRDLAFHELTHNIMYLHMINIFGPAGSSFHLPFMPAWFIEGLAEALSMSSGSSYIAGVERYQALTGDWPSYARLHSLYKNGFAQRGYATSAGLVHYILQTYGDRALVEILQNFYNETMPWHWPGLLIPYLVDLPMDLALLKVTGKRGATLYNDYKRYSQNYWRRSKLPFFSNKAGYKISAASSLESTGQEFHLTFGNYSKLYRSKIVQSEDGLSTEKITDLPNESTTYVYNAGYTAYAEIYETNSFKYRTRIINHHAKSGRETILVDRYGKVVELFNTGNRLAWLEILPGKKQFCFINKADLTKSFNLRQKKISCPFSGSYPTSIHLLGSEKVFLKNSKKKLSSFLTTKIWLSEKTETIRESRSKLFFWDTKTSSVHQLELEDSAEVIAYTAAGHDHYLLVAERDRNTIRRIGINGSCHARIKTDDHILGIEGNKSGEIALRLFAGAKEKIHILKNPKSIEVPCKKATTHDSAILSAINSKTPISYQAALSKSDYKTPGYSQDESELYNRFKDKNTEKTSLKEKTTSARWRPRSVFFMPWFGTEAYGTSLGLLSVPLMDHMQNEDIRLTSLYGINSNYPDTYLTLNSARFKYPLQLSVFRRQVFNGSLTNRDTLETTTSYLDEAGLQLEATLPFPAQHMNVKLNQKYSHLQPWTGQHARLRRGNLAESSADFFYRQSFGRDSFGLGLGFTAAPQILNYNFDYHKVRTSANWSHKFDFLSSTLILDSSLSGTRGRKQRELKEYYSPLKTFIPGSGGGYNQNSFAIYGNGTLFTGRYGDTQGRVQASITLPLVKDGNRLINILYLDRIDLTSFINHGGAWYGEIVPEDSVLETAHGHNIDAQLDLKGIGLNLGLGVGQVLKSEYQVYIKFGFDAIL